MSHSIGVVTTSRADYGIYRPLLQELDARDDVELLLYVTGMHLADTFGHTVREIEAEGFAIHERIESLLGSDSPQSVAKTIGLGTTGFAQSFARRVPDVLVVLGDRFEMLAAAIAALPFRVPVAHIHGGETTEGAIDESTRHAMTKLSHVHFASTPEYAARIVQMGEDPARVFAFGAPSLDNLLRLEVATRDELEADLGLEDLANDPPLLVTFHPVTLEHEDTRAHVGALIEALGSWEGPIVITQSNADTAGHLVREAMDAFTAAHARAIAVDHLGTRRYFGLMRHAAAMVGNSSSGIIEAASFELPVVNIGARQRGRAQNPNTIDTPPEAEAIRAAIARATSQEFRASLAGVPNIYGVGDASTKIADALVGMLERGPIPVRKPFHDHELP